MTPAPPPDTTCELIPTGSATEVAFVLRLGVRTFRQAQIPAVTTLYSACSQLPARPRVDEFGDYQFTGIVDAPTGYLGLRFAKTIAGPDLDKVTIQTNNLPPNEYFDELKVTETVQRINDATALPTVTPGGGVSLVRNDEEDVAAATRIITSFIGAGQTILTGQEYDERTGLIMPVTRELVAHDTATGANLTDNGTYTEVQALNSQWAIKTTRKATAEINTVRSWNDVENYYWPAVLTSWSFANILNRSDIIDQVIFHHQMIDDYNGPCDVLYQESWTKTAPAAESTTRMIPTAIRLALVFASYSIPPCLHGAYTVTEASGTNHPRYPSFTNSVTFPATNFTTRPASVIGSVSTRPYRGGYLKRKMTVYRPN